MGGADGLPHVLVLGGTSEGRHLARALLAPTPPHGAHAPALRVTSSLAGRVAHPLLPAGEVRIGGFGGVAGLVSWLRRHEVDVVVDATHPYAATMTSHAAQASARTGIPLVRLDRLPWRPGPDDRWHPVDAPATAAAAVDALGERAFLTTGRSEVAAFAQVRAWCLLRSIEPPDPPLPARHELLLDRGPFDVAGERTLLRRWGIDVLVTKNSGGPATAPKLTAARELGIPVIVVERPTPPPGLTVVHTVDEAVSWVRQAV